MANPSFQIKSMRILLRLPANVTTRSNAEIALIPSVGERLSKGKTGFKKLEVVVQCVSEYFGKNNCKQELVTALESTCSLGIRFVRSNKSNISSIFTFFFLRMLIFQLYTRYPRKRC